MGLKVDTIQNPTSATVNLTLDTSGNVTTGANLTVTGTTTLGGNPTTAGTVVMGSSFLRNRIINGDMRISQRGTSFSAPTAGVYTLDRWAVGWVGAAPASVAQISGPASFKNALQITGAASNTVVNAYQRIESLNCTDLSGATVTIQANISVSSAQTVAWYLQYPTASDNYTSVTTISNGTWSATTTATTFTATITNLPSGALNGLQLIISPNNAGAFTSGTIAITGVQLEVGSVATPFERRQYGQELALCQRYYYRNTAPSTGTLLTTSGITQSATSAIAMTQFPVTMRAAPTALEQSGTAAHYQVFISSNVACSAVPTFLAANVWYATTTATAASGLGGNLPCWITAANTAAYLGWSAEL